MFPDLLTLDPVTQFVTVDDPTPTVSVLWDIAVQQAVVETAPGPTIASRAYAITHTAIYEAWAAHDEAATGLVTGDALQVGGDRIDDANKAEAMSWAAYTALVDLFPAQEPDFAAVMAGLGFDTTAPVAEGSAAALGIAAGEAVIAARADDGANQAGGYADTTGYTPTNTGPDDVNDITAWTPEFVPIDPDEAAERPGEDPQSFLTPHWGEVTPFALESGDAIRPEAPEPFFMDGVIGTLDIEAGTVTVEGQGTLDVTPDLVGTIINPGFIEQAEEVIDFSANLTDEQKLIAEFWEDGGGTSFPPGTWMTFGQFVSARDDHTIDQDAALFFALGNAVFDAGIATWEAKVFYDYARPVRAVRDLGELGLIGEEGTDYLGNDGIVIDAYAGPGLGTQTILAEEFVTYQTPGADVSPPFAEYTSGHSAFSAAGAAVLQAFTGSDEFGGEITFEAGTSRFEPGETPGEDLTLAWETFSEAADEGGISRLYGGIHFDDGDINGRTLGTEAGAGAYEAADALVTGAVAEVVDIRLRGDGGDSILTAGRGDDRAAGRGGDDVMSGLLGDDVLRGGAGDDELYGGEGDDRLIGGAGDDFLSGGEGDDLYRTGPGADTVLYTAGDDTIRDFRLGGGTRPGDTLIFDLDGEERALSSEADFLEMVALLADDGDAATGALIDGRDLTLVFSGEDTILLDGVVSRRGLDDDALAEAGATLLA